MNLSEAILCFTVNGHAMQSSGDQERLTQCAAEPLLSTISSRDQTVKQQIQVKHPPYFNGYLLFFFFFNVLHLSCVPTAGGGGGRRRR